MIKCGQRGGLTVRLEGFLCHTPPLSRGGPLSRHQTARGGLTTHPFPGACVYTSTHPHTGAVVSVCGKWRLRSGRALSPPGPLPPPSAMEAPEVLWQWRGATDGGFIVESPGHLVSVHSQCRKGPTDGAVGAHPLCALFLTGVATTSAGGPVDGATGARPLCAPGHRSSHWPNGWRLCWPPLLLHRSAAGSHILVCMCMTKKLHDTMRGKPTSPLSTLLPLPSASSLVPSLLWLSLPCSPCSPLPVCLFFLASLVVPPPSRSVPGTLHDTVPCSFSFPRDRLARAGRRLPPAAAGSPLA